MRSVHRLTLATIAALGGIAAAVPGPVAAETVPPSAPSDSSAPAAAADDLYPAQPLDEEVTLTIGISSRIESFLNLFLADEMGEFEKENISVEFEIVPTSDSTLLLSQGDIDVVPTSMSAGNFNLVAEGNELRGVFPLSGEPGDSMQGFWARTDALGDDGFQPEDLVGQRVLTPSGPGSYGVGYFWQTVLRPAGVAPNDVNWERMTPSDAPLALTSGAAPAAFLISPLWQVVADDGCCEFLGGYPDAPISFVAFGPNLLDGDPAVGEAVVRALARTVVGYMQGDYHNDPEIAPAAAELLEQPLDVYQSQPSLVWDPTFPLDIAEFDAVQQFFADTGVLSYEDPLTLEDIFEHRFIEALGVS